MNRCMAFVPCTAAIVAALLLFGPTGLIALPFLLVLTPLLAGVYFGERTLAAIVATARRAARGRIFSPARRPRRRLDAHVRFAPLALPARGPPPVGLG